MDSQTRQEYIRAAVSFLQNPKLVDSSLKDKLKFLKDKGLSDIEVDEALNLALVPRNQSQSGRWNFLLILGLCVGGYKLYKAYLDGRLEQDKQVDVAKSKTVSDSTSCLQDSQSCPQPTMTSTTLDQILKGIKDLKKQLDLQRNNFGGEMQSLKTLLLGHEKFAAPPKIPKWQLKHAPENGVDHEAKNADIEQPEIKTKSEETGKIYVLKEPKGEDTIVPNQA